MKNKNYRLCDSEGQPLYKYTFDSIETAKAVRAMLGRPDWTIK